MKKVYIIILNFNGENDTHECIESLFKLKKNSLEIEIVIVDNGSNIEFRLSDLEKKNNVILIRNKDNLGFSGGNNTGIDYAIKNGAEYVILLNNDTIVDNNFLLNL